MAGAREERIDSKGNTSGWRRLKCWEKQRRRILSAAWQQLLHSQLRFKSTTEVQNFITVSREATMAEHSEATTRRLM